jgi:hypothetical protein
MKHEDKLFIINPNSITNIKTLGIITTTALIAVLATTPIASTLSTQQQVAYAFTPDWIPMYSDLVYAPVAASGENVYVTFWDDKTGPRKPFVVASNDSGETFGNPIMLNATATNNATQTTTPE